MRASAFRPLPSRVGEAAKWHVEPRFAKAEENGRGERGAAKLPPDFSLTSRAAPTKVGINTILFPRGPQEKLDYTESPK